MQTASIALRTIFYATSCRVPVKPAQRKQERYTTAASDLVGPLVESIQTSVIEQSSQGRVTMRLLRSQRSLHQYVQVRIAFGFPPGPWNLRAPKSRACYMLYSSVHHAALVCMTVDHTISAWYGDLDCALPTMLPLILRVFAGLLWDG